MEGILLDQEFLSFPEEIADAYSYVYEWLSKLMPGFDKKGPPSNLNQTKNDNENRRNTGREFTYLLPGHTMKVYQSFLLMEDEACHNNRSNFLDKPRVSIIDDGCGGGTATIALISLMVNYQKYRLANNLPIFHIRMFCLGLDPNRRALDIYGKFLQKCNDNIEPLLITLEKPQIIEGTFPNETARVNEWLEFQENIHCVILALSNVIRPITDQHNLLCFRRNWSKAPLELV